MMARKMLCLVTILMGLCAVVFAQATVKTTAEAFTAGKEFAHTAIDTVADNLSSHVGQEHLPYYTKDAPEGQHFQKGRNMITGTGDTKKQHCKTHRAANGFAQQECDAVNFLSQHRDTRKKFAVDKNTDPILIGSKNIINHPGPTPGSSKPHCRVEKTHHPATFLTETCTESMTLTEVRCHIQWEVTTHQVHEITHGQSCVSFKGVGMPGGSYIGPTENYGFKEIRQATAYLDQGYNQLYLAGKKIGVYTPWQKDNCYINASPHITVSKGSGHIRGVLAIWKDAGGYITPGIDSCTPSALHQVGYGATMNLCKTGCANYKKAWVCGGNDNNSCNWAYTCDNNGGSTVCPKGWRDIGGACREMQFDTLLANHCTLTLSAKNPLVTDGSDTIHSFYCAKEINACTDFAIRHQ